MGPFFKIFPDFSQNRPKFKKIVKNWVTLLKNMVQNRANWYMNGSLFLEKFISIIWVYFQISWRHVPTKTKLEYPLDLPEIFQQIKKKKKKKIVK